MRVCAHQAVDRARTDPWWAPLDAALSATAATRAVLEPFLADYQSEAADDVLPLLWAGDAPPDPVSPRG